MLNPYPRRNLSALVPGVLSAFLVFACGGKDGSEVDGGKGTGGSSGNGQPNLGGSGPNLAGSGPNLGGSSGNGTPTPITPDAACATGTATADAIPAVVQMVVDISGSMEWGADGDEDPPFGMSKWDITSEALKDAVTKLPATVAVGLNFYPNNPRGDACIRNAIGLPIALLGDADSQQRDAFNEAIDDVRPNGGTPTHAAFLFGADTVAASDLEGRKFVILITDGVPTYTLECDGNGQDAVDNAPLIAAVAETFTSDMVSTFVIGSPGSDDARADLSQMATVGGTAKAACSNAGAPEYCHLDMTQASDFGAALAAGLADIAGRISACEYAVPPPPNGKTLDPSLVNVLYTSGDSKPKSIAQDPTGKCEQGWVYDDPQKPTKITLCGADCDAVKADATAKIDLLFGCVTDVGEPPK